LLSVLAVAIVSMSSFTFAGFAHASTPRWAHPKAEAWLVMNARDMGALLSDFQVVYGEMQTCSSTNGPDRGSSEPCEGVSSDPGDWAMRTSRDCPRVIMDVGTMQSDGPIPLVQAENLLSTALHELTLGCGAIALAQNAYLVSPATEANNQAVSDPADSAAADVQAASTLLQRVDNALNARK
jgi:hypothetical protein